jgi:hypothetical protein
MKAFNQLTTEAQKEYLQFLSELELTSACRYENNFSINSNHLDEKEIYLSIEVREIECQNGQNFDFDEIMEEMSIRFKKNSVSVYFSKYYQKLYDKSLEKTSNENKSFLETIKFALKDIIETISEAEGKCDCHQCEQDRYDRYCEDRYDDRKVG